VFDLPQEPRKELVVLPPGLLGDMLELPFGSFESPLRIVRKLPPCGRQLGIQPPRQRRELRELPQAAKWPQERRLPELPQEAGQELGVQPPGQRRELRELPQAAEWALERRLPELPPQRGTQLGIQPSEELGMQLLSYAAEQPLRHELRFMPHGGHLVEEYALQPSEDQRTARHLREGLHFVPPEQPPRAGLLLYLSRQQDGRRR
jgi:hypothetical protein